jgi:hypothetical protein
MFRAAINGAIGISLLISVPLAGAEIRFKTMKLPPHAHVRIEGSTARITGEKLGIETVWNCLCSKGKGTCTIGNEMEALTCFKGSADNCKDECFLSIDLGGFLSSPLGNH